MNTQPPIIITRADLQRLEALLNGLAEYGPAAQALEDELSRAQVVGHDQVPAGVVTMNSRVCCRDEGTGKEYQLTLVYPGNTGADGQSISVFTPAGSALLGLAVGQSIDWPTVDGHVVRLSVLEVTSQPEARGDFES